MPSPLTEAAALERLRETSEAIVGAVEDHLAAWAEAQVRRLLDAWSRADPATRARAEAEARAAGPRVTARVAGELRDLFALDPDVMRATPLEVVRTAVREPTAILLAAGVPAVERDEFSTRSWPDDRYGLTPATLGDVASDPRTRGDLDPLQLAWGLARVGVLRARA